MTHRIGDRVRVECPESMVHGMETTVIEVGASCWSAGKSFIGDVVDINPADYDSSASQAAFYSHELIPIDDGNEKASWSDCVWKPKVLERV